MYCIRPDYGLADPHAKNPNFLFETKGLFGTTHNSFMSCCELFFFCQTLISKIASWMKLFFFSSHKDISWDEVEKSSLS